MSAEILRALILVAVFSAVLLGAEVAISSFRNARGMTAALNKRLTLISRGVSRDEVLVKLRRRTPAEEMGGLALLGPFQARLARTLAGAGLKISGNRIILYLVLAAVAVFALALWLVYAAGILITPSRVLLLMTFAAALGFALPLMVLSRIADRRRKLLTNQFPIALDVFVRGLKAGHPVSAALELVSTEMTDPIGTEFGLVMDEVTYGADLKDALQNMADRCGVEDMQMFVVSLSIQSETGGNLAEILGNLAGVIRERMAMMLKVRALSSEGRMTALILTILPIFSFVMLFMMQPTFFLDVAADPLFIPSFLGLLVIFAIGVFWIRKLIDLKV